MDNGNTISRFALLCVAGSIPGFLAIVNDIREKLRTANSGKHLDLPNAISLVLQESGSSTEFGDHRV